MNSMTPETKRERERERRKSIGVQTLPHAGEAHLTSNIFDLSLPYAGKTLLSNPPSTIPDPSKIDPPKQISTPTLPYHRSTNT